LTQQLGAAHEKLAEFRRLPDGSECTSPGSSLAPSLAIGIIGCGLVGNAIATTLLDIGLAPSQLIVSTRSPERQRELAARGALVTFDNERTAARCHVLILCVLPAHLPEVSRAVRKGLTPKTLVLSVVAAVPTKKLRSLLESDHALAVSADAARVRSSLRSAEPDAAAEPDAPPTARALPTSTLLDHAASSLFADGAACTQLVHALGAMVHGVEGWSAEEGTALCLDSLVDDPADAESIGPALGLSAAPPADDAAAVAERAAAMVRLQQRFVWSMTRNLT